MTASTTAPNRPLISADSHVIEPIDVWDGLLPDGYWGGEPATFSQRPGGFDPKARTDEMATDGVSAEVLYPSLAMKLFALEDPALQRSCFRRYNAWLAEYCTVSPQRLLGIGLIPAYDMDAAVEEVAWCKRNGLRGVQVWQIPPPNLPFNGLHYEPLWEACADSGLSVSLHILTGFGYALDIFKYGGDLVTMGEFMFRLSIIEKLRAVQDALLQLVLSGALDRHRGLRLVLVENECAWLPFFVDQLDYYYHRYEGKSPVALERPPSQTFADQVYTTFFRDPNAELVVRQLGAGNLMWSSDYPHGNSTWPESRRVVQERLGALPEDTVHQLVWGNACRLFDIDLVAPDGSGI
jgi:predicted TIM-barrel fold metal-dependent hydrolase